MADVKWIKITTDIFDDEKILLIESMPDSDAIIVIWFKLLILAGKQNNSGVFMMSNKIPYTDGMLATIFRRKEATVKMALQIFEQFGMIEIIDGVITIPNWDKHQSLDAYEKKKCRDRLYQQERRANQRALIEKSSDTSSDVAVSDKDKEGDKDKEKDINNNIISPLAKEKRHKYGAYNNVLLSDTDMEKLKTEFPDWQERIERLSEYIASTGKSYKNHLATIRNWAKRDMETAKKSSDGWDYINSVARGGAL